jgi:trehalose-6-phosphate synthase
MKSFRLRLVAALLFGIIIVSVIFTYFDVLAHKHALRTDLERRTQWFGASLQPQLEEQFNNVPRNAWPVVLQRLRKHPDQPGLAVFDDSGILLGSAGIVLPLKDLPTDLINRTLLSGKEIGAFVRTNEDESEEQSQTQSHSLTEAQSESVNAAGVSGAPSVDSSPTVHLWYEDAIPLYAGDHTVGTLLVLANADYIHDEGNDVWRRSSLRIAAIVLLVVVVTLVMVHLFMQGPVNRAAAWLRRLRHGEGEVDEGAREFTDLLPLAKEVTSLAMNLTRARAAAESEARLRDASERVWTADRLSVHARERLGDGKLFVVSNREPYMHVRIGKEIQCIVPPSGVVTAIEPILHACEGTWIAHGSGGEDAAFVDEHDRLRVPPDDMRYTLRRVWLSAEEEAGYYEGFSNEGLWPLCHIAHTRPIFRASDWSQYQSVNEKFAEALLEEMRGVAHPVVLVQDYHFALLPKIIKQLRPDARVAIFWHIPWPNADAFAICPWQAELLDGLVAADVIGFHLQSHCNNFLDTVDHVLEARTDWEHFSIRRKGHHSAVRPYPISVAWDDSETSTESIIDAEMEADKLLQELGIEGKQLLLGVDRMDYTKGIVERLLAYEHLLQERPWYLEQIVFVQIASPSRTRIPSYVNLRIQVEETVERINRRFQTSRWKPVILIQRQCSHQELARYYQAAALCLVTSLHDGMNLVAKEYLSARKDCDGVLILSRFTGSAQELRDALLVNPYDIQQVSDTICAGLEMNRAERRLRMERMRIHVKENNVYRWASNILTDLCAVRLEDELLGVAMNRSNRKLA